MTSDVQTSEAASGISEEKQPTSHTDAVRKSAQGEYEIGPDVDLPLHPATTTFPAFDHQIDDMVESLEDSGQMEPVIVYQGQILDGQKRNRARKRLKRPLKCKDLTDLGGLTPLEWVVRKNMTAGTARQLNDSQRALIGAKLCRRVYEVEARNRMRAGKRLPDDERAKACEKAARAVNVRVNRLRQALKVVDADCSELEKAVSHGTLVISTAAKIAELRNDRARKHAIAAAKNKEKDVLRDLLSTSSQVKDGLGREVTQKMRPLFLRVRGWQAQIKRLQDVVDWLRASADNPESRGLVVEVDPAGLETAIQKIETVTPWCQCPYCDHFPDRTCPLCSGTGFLTKAEHAAAVARSAEFFRRQPEAS